MSAMRRATSALCLGLGHCATLDVRSYGAVGDGKTDDTHAFEAAIADLQKRGGGSLLVPPVDAEYLIRPINLTSNMNLHIQGGAKVSGIADQNVWPVIPGAPSYGQGRDHVGPRFTSLLHGEHLQNVSITGDGNSSILNGNGKYWWDLRKSLSITRGHLIEMMYSSDIQIHDISMVDSPFWNNHFFDCDRVHVQRVSISAPDDSPNTDGWDPDSSRNVLIEDSWYSAGDDCIAIKSGWDCFGTDYGKPSVNITVRNLSCHGRYAGVAIGSEMSGGVENVTVSNVRFTKANGPAHIKTGLSRGGYVRNVHFRDLVVVGPVDYGLLVDAFYGDRNPSCPSDWQPSAAPGMSNYSFVNIDGREAPVSKNSFHFKGSKDSPIEGVYLENVTFGSGSSKPDWDCDAVTGTAKQDGVAPWPPCAEIAPKVSRSLVV
jgi:polygalacturonase